MRWNVNKGKNMLGRVNQLNLWLPIRWSFEEVTASPEYNFRFLPGQIDSQTLRMGYVTEVRWGAYAADHWVAAGTLRERVFALSQSDLYSKDIEDIRKTFITAD
jgi:hypothetical protein